MLLTSNVTVKWVQNKTKTHYLEKGYNFTYFGDEFQVPIENLPKNSNVTVKVICDYCYKEVHKRYRDYKKSIEESPIKKDACNNCHPLKTKEGNRLLHGVEHYTQKSEEREKVGDRKRHNHEYIKEEFRKRGLILITPIYINSLQLLEYICTKHSHKGIMNGSWSNIINQIGCGYCGHEEGAKKQRLQYEEVKELFNSKGFILLTPKEEYVHTKSLLSYRCKKHPEDLLENSADGIRYIKGCRKCYVERNRGENSYNWKGGLTILKDFLRGHIKEWRKNSLKSCNYKCVITGKPAEVIHHLYSFNFLMDIVFEKLQLDIHSYPGDYKEEEQNLLAEMIKQVHYEYGLGVALTREMHILFHKRYGSEYNTPSQFEEFKQLITLDRVNF